MCSQHNGKAFAAWSDGGASGWQLPGERAACLPCASPGKSDLPISRLPYPRGMNRREVLRRLASLPMVLCATSPVAGCKVNEPQLGTDLENARSISLKQATAPKPTVSNKPTNFSAAAIHLLDEVRERGSHYFLECSDAPTWRRVLISPERFGEDYPQNCF